MPSIPSSPCLPTAPAPRLRVNLRFEILDSPKKRVNNRPGRPRRPDRAYLVHKRTKGISPDCGAVARRGGYAGWGTILAPTLIVQTSDIARPRENSRSEAKAARGAIYAGFPVDRALIVHNSM